MNDDLFDLAREQRSKPTIAQTFTLAASAHGDQLDKLARPYFDHPRAVAALLSPFGREAVIAGALHDAVEDTSISLADLLDAGYSYLVVGAVEAVSRMRDERYDAFIARCARHPLGRHVKLADLTHNTWPARVRALRERDDVDLDQVDARVAKYLRAIATLRAAGATLAPASQAFADERDPLPCPVLSDTGRWWCAKPIQDGWTPAEGHGGGHWWTSWRSALIAAGGHYDATAAISGRPFGGHLPEECGGPEECAYWHFLDRAKQNVVLARLGGAR